MEGMADRIRLLVPTSNIHDLAALALLLNIVITVIHTHSLDAWEVLAQVLTRRAVMRYDNLIGKGAGHAFFDDVPEQREEAMAVSRELNYAAQFSEAFFQALWYTHAQRSAQAPVEVDFAELLPAFSGTLRNYETLQAALDVLTYSPLGRNGQSFSLPRATAAPPREAVVLVVTVVGAWADVGVVTFWRACCATARPPSGFSCSATRWASATGGACSGRRGRPRRGWRRRPASTTWTSSRTRACGRTWRGCRRGAPRRT
ncbi:unnamed protein product [Prorocentrum cordatum]|uniref:Phospholipase B-like n=1 Tax=Prorocentrum cordatum TaxID=2364126 RepID=A0ABN9VS57_9DINO|nr:unnamed protein product [Polarella glacialis]